MKKLLGVALLLLSIAASAQVIPQPGPPTPIGCAQNTVEPTLGNGQAGWVQCNNKGEVRVDGSSAVQPISGTVTANQGTAGASPWPVTTGTISNAKLNAAGSSLVAKSSAGSLVSVSGSGVSGSYIMLFDATSAPVDGAVAPVKCWGPLSISGPFVFGWTGSFLPFATGITIVSSSTGCFTKTATNANFISAEYQ